MTTMVAARTRVSAERRFYLAMTLALLATVCVGFARTFFLKPWFPEVARFAPPEGYFYIHDTFFAAWFVLLVIQPALVTAGRVDVHRRLGQLGAVLAAVMVVLGLAGGVIAATRPTGFMGVPVPPLQFLAIPVTAMMLFGLFFVLAYRNRRDPQRHKRYMLLASIGMLDAAVARLPFGTMMSPSPVPLFSYADLVVMLFLLAMVGWDLASRGRLHAVTLGGGLVIVASQPLRFMVSATEPWLTFAGWLVGLAS